MNKDIFNHLPLFNQVALITGASRGLGRELALELSKAGAHTILLARSKAGLEELDDEIRQIKQGQKKLLMDLNHPDDKANAISEGATLIPFNLEKTADILPLAPSIYQRFGRLDILIGNAAILGITAPFHQIEDKIWDKTMQLNVTANQRLIKAFDPLLRQSPTGRSIMISSQIAENHLPYFSPYAASKAALEAMVNSYAQELPETSNYRILSLRPGRMGTDMQSQAFPGVDFSDIPTPKDVATLFVEFIQRDITREQTLFSIQGEKTALKIASI